MKIALPQDRVCVKPIFESSTFQEERKKYDRANVGYKLEFATKVAFGADGEIQVHEVDTTKLTDRKVFFIYDEDLVEFTDKGETYYIVCAEDVVGEVTEE